MQKHLKEIIEDWAEYRKIDVDIMCFENAEAFIMKWPEIEFNLAFLDIQMKNVTGIELANIIRKTNNSMQIVFITSFSQYALEGYNVNALHYLIKPASSAKVLPILDKALSIWRATQDSFILVKNDSGCIKISLGDVLYISILSHTASLHTNDSTHEMRKTMSELIGMLPSYYIRIHRSYIVNLFKVDCIYKDSLLLSNETKLPISRSYSKDVKDAFILMHTMR
jgi:DNA-binding LytR/AlgR family response regulator